MRRREWKWEGPEAPTVLRDRFFDHFDALAKEKTPRLERYRHLMELVKLQLFYLAFTFI